MAKADKTGRTKAGEHFARMPRHLMEAPAWRTLPTAAMALHPWLLLEWHGPPANSNGRISLGVRDAARRLGIPKDTAARAFRALQAKGFIAVTEGAHLGSEGHGKAAQHELADLPMPHSGQHGGRRLYGEWKKGQDFEVAEAVTPNPTGRNGRRRSPSWRSGRWVIERRTTAVVVLFRMTGRHRNQDEPAQKEPGAVLGIRTSSSTRYLGWERMIEAAGFLAQHRGSAWTLEPRPSRTRWHFDQQASADR